MGDLGDKGESGIGRYEPGRQGRRDRVTHILLFIPFNNISVSTTIQFKIISEKPPHGMFLKDTLTLPFLMLRYIV